MYEHIMKVGLTFSDFLLIFVCEDSDAFNF